MNILLGGKKCVKFLLRYTIAFIVRIFFSFLLILNIPIAILLILLSPFFKIKIGELEMRAIGHSSISMEIFLSELENKIHDNSDDIYIWFVNDGYFPFERKKISNKFLYEKWKEKITIGPRYIFEPLFYIFRFLRKINIGNKFLIPYRHWKDHKNTKPWNIVDINNVLIKTLPQINFSDEEEKNGQKYLKKYDLKKNEYILFMARTNEYRIDDASSLRDSNIFTMIYGLNKICKEKKLKAVRFGYSPKNKLNSNDTDIIDYSNSIEKSDFLDFYLAYNCKFMVGAASGGSMINLMNRKKLLLVNYGDIGELNHLTYSLIPFILPKKFKNQKTGNFVKYSEVFSKRLYQAGYYTSSSKDFMFENNTEKEISDAIYEMNNYVDNINFEYEKELQKKFWKIFEENLGYKPEKGVVKVSPSFLKNNKELIN